MAESTVHKEPNSRGRKEEIGDSDSFWKTTWKSFKKNRLALFALYVVGTLIVVALFADVLAYSKPYYAVYKGKTYYPLAYDYMAGLGLYSWPPELVNEKFWRELELEESIWPPVRYQHKDIDLDNGHCKSPTGKQFVDTWKSRHFLGTDEMGHDVLAGLIHGSRISLTVGMISVGIAAFIGVFLGAFAGYYGDNQLKMSRIRLLFSLIGLFFGFFYGIFLRTDLLAEKIGTSVLGFLFHLILSLAILIIIPLVFAQLARPLEKIPLLGKKVNLWIDIFISRIIEIVNSVPKLLLIITISSIAPPSLYLVMVIIGLTSWTTIARLTRGEMLKARNLEYVQAARAMGFNEVRIIVRHALPNVLAPVLVTIAFGIASAILLEASLSFLGIGVPPGEVTWGSALNQARGHADAWWLAIFPGFAIFITVTVFNLLGEGLRDALDPKLNK